MRPSGSVPRVKRTSASKIRFHLENTIQAILPESGAPEKTSFKFREKSTGPSRQGITSLRFLMSRGIYLGFRAQFLENPRSVILPEPTLSRKPDFASRRNSDDFAKIWGSSSAKLREKSTGPLRQGMTSLRLLPPCANCLGFRAELLENPCSGILIETTPLRKPFFTSRTQTSAKLREKIPGPCVRE